MPGPAGPKGEMVSAVFGCKTVNQICPEMGVPIVIVHIMQNYDAVGVKVILMTADQIKYF